ncbi:hypothetical protein LX32DRAFT_725481 [Colletotrichum zoysiae]|uniref:Uncharacterized protein n=1 Tax=Colletotrichum zoysiae TaxID=1216348 RepID=A0AAD9HQ93_9PEZI|nr:hypothetical protein LX32DRAFT_725481 [Colletotrichum zoysiae]
MAGHRDHQVQRCSWSKVFLPKANLERHNQSDYSTEGKHMERPGNAVLGASAKAASPSIPEGTHSARTGNASDWSFGRKVHLGNIKFTVGDLVKESEDLFTMSDIASDVRRGAAGTPAVLEPALTQNSIYLHDPVCPLGTTPTYEWVWSQPCPGGFDAKNALSRESMKVHASHSRISQATDSLENEYGVVNNPLGSFSAFAGHWVVDDDESDPLKWSEWSHRVCTSTSAANISSVGRASGAGEPALKISESTRIFNQGRPVLGSVFEQQLNLVDNP